MFDGKSKHEVLKLWLQAADEFSNAPTPHVTAFGKLTGKAYWHISGREDLWLTVHVVEEIVGALAASSPDKVDRMFLRSRLATASTAGRSTDLIDECRRAGMVTKGDGEARAEEIKRTIQRRRVALGIKGRSYRFD